MAIRADQEGRSAVPEFLQSAWKAGVVGNDADFVGRQMIYYGVNGEQHLEEYPAVEVKM